jgi:hypothetical protein
MRRAAFALILLAAVTGTSEAQGRRGNASSQGIPPGQMPRAGECRVWYDGLPPGRQPAPTNCDQAERVASRSRDARVIYGADDRYATRNSDQRYRDRDRVSTYPNTRGTAYNSVPFQNGDRDGYEKGREDAERNNSFDPVRHSRYRSADRGYNNRYGTKDDYKLVYREGFEAGYERGYRELRGYGANRGSTGGYRVPRF